MVTKGCVSLYYTITRARSAPGSEDPRYYDRHIDSLMELAGFQTVGGWGGEGFGGTSTDHIYATITQLQAF